MWLLLVRFFVLWLLMRAFGCGGAGLRWWGAGGSYADDNENGMINGEKQGGGENKKMDGMKAKASAGLGKAKGAAVVGASKVKAGTSVGIKWIKNQYEKRKSSSK